MNSLTLEQIKNKLVTDSERLRVVRAELFTMANSYAGDRYGYIAQGLHEVCNSLTQPLHFIPVEMSRLITANIIAETEAETEAEAAIKEALDIQHANYEEYSYYVGGEITCDKMPMKFGPWLSARQTKKT